MKITIVTCFESNEERVNFIYDACKARNYEVKAYSSDFSHIHKQVRTKAPDGITLIKTKSYKKNLSFGRIFGIKEKNGIAESAPVFGDQRQPQDQGEGDAC